MNETSNHHEEEEESIDLMAIVNLLIGKWYWFALSLTLAVTIGATYLYITPKSYNRTATILIKDKNSGALGNSTAAFADLAGLNGLSQSSSENEMLILKSRNLMERVVTRLGVHITYYERAFMRDLELYEQSPFRIRESAGGTLMPLSFTLTALDAEHFRLQLEEGEAIEGHFNEEILFPFGLASIECYPQLLAHRENQAIKVVIANRKRVTSGYIAAINAHLVSKNASIVQVGLNTTRPGKAADIINTLLELYNQDAIEDKNLVLDNSQAFIDERLAIIRQDLVDVDSRIEVYKRATLSTNINAESSLYLQNASSLEEKISGMQIQASLIQILADFINKPSNKSELLPLNIGLDNANLNAQIQSYNENLIKMNRLVAASSERNPVVVDMNVALQAARTSIEKTVGDLQRSISMQQRDLTSRNQRTTGRIEAVSTNERNVQSIERDQTIKAELYLYLLNKSEENAIMRSMTEPNARIIDHAFGEDTPIAPRKAIILLACLMLGLMIPAAFFVATDLLYTKVRGREDVTKVIKAPMLGEIPVRSKKDAPGSIQVKQGSTSQISEAFRILRTNLSYMDTDGKMQVLASSSTMPGEGKTYTSINLALTLALSGKSVCLVDLDLRRRTLCKEFNLAQQSGVTEYLAGKEQNLDKLLQVPTTESNLTILPAGSTPPNPAELLMSDRYEALIAELRQRFDYIVIDNPPYNVVADGSIANRCVDLTFYVVRAGYTDRRKLNAVQELYREGKLKHLCVILTDVDYERLYYSMGYNGADKHYGYGYGGYSKYVGKYYN